MGVILENFEKSLKWLKKMDSIDTMYLFESNEYYHDILPLVFKLMCEENLEKDAVRSIYQINDYFVELVLREMIFLDTSKQNKRCLELIKVLRKELTYEIKIQLLEESVIVGNTTVFCYLIHMLKDTAYCNKESIMCVAKTPPPRMQKILFKKFDFIELYVKVDYIEVAMIYGDVMYFWEKFTKTYENEMGIICTYYDYNKEEQERERGAKIAKRKMYGDDSCEIK